MKIKSIHKSLAAIVLAALLPHFSEEATGEEIRLEEWQRVRMSSKGEAEVDVTLPPGNSSSVLHVWYYPPEIPGSSDEPALIGLEVEGYRDGGPSWPLETWSYDFWKMFWNVTSGGCYIGDQQVSPRAAMPNQFPLTPLPTYPGQAASIEFPKNACEEVEAGRPYKARLRFETVAGDARNKDINVFVKESLHGRVGTAAGIIDRKLYMEAINPCTIRVTRYRWKGGVPVEHRVPNAERIVEMHGGRSFVVTDLSKEEIGGAAVYELAGIGSDSSYGVCLKHGEVINGFPE